MTVLSAPNRRLVAEAMAAMDSSWVLELLELVRQAAQTHLQAAGFEVYGLLAASPAVRGGRFAVRSCGLAVLDPVSGSKFVVQVEFQLCVQLDGGDDCNVVLLARGAADTAVFASHYLAAAEVDWPASASMPVLDCLAASLNDHLGEPRMARCNDAATQFVRALTDRLAA